MLPGLLQAVVAASLAVLLALPVLPLAAAYICPAAPTDLFFHGEADRLLSFSLPLLAQLGYAFCCVYLFDVCLLGRVPVSDCMSDMAVHGQLAVHSGMSRCMVVATCLSGCACMRACMCGCMPVWLCGGVGCVIVWVLRTWVNYSLSDSLQRGTLPDPCGVAVHAGSPRIRQHIGVYQHLVNSLLYLC